MNEMNLEKLYDAVQNSFPTISENKKFQEMTNKRKWVSEFQENLKRNLESVEKENGWETEYTFPDQSENDRIDIFHKRSSEWIIEIDATRADQIAKKFVSRLALCGLEDSISYVAIMYPDTKNGKAECEKYLRYCSKIIKKTNPESVVYGLFIDPDNREKTTQVPLP